MDSYSEAPNDLVVHGEVITPGAYVEASDGYIGQVERLIGPRPGAESAGSMLVRTRDGQALTIAADAIRHVVPNQPAPNVYLRVSRAFLGLPAEPQPQTSSAGPVTPAEASAGTQTEQRTPVPGSDVVVPLAEEHLTADTTWAERGRAHIHKRVAFENQRSVVPLTYEQVIVEHIAPEMFDANAPRSDDELIIPVVEERLVVRKETVVREYVRVRKQSSVRQFEAHGQVRREVVQVDETPNSAFADTSLPLIHEQGIGAAGATGATGAAGAAGTTNQTP